MIDSIAPMPIICAVLIVISYVFLSIFGKKNLPQFKLKKWQCCLILVFFTAVFSAAKIYNGHSWGGDFSCYIAQAKSILTGTMSEQVSVNNYIVSNSSFQVGPAAYPWGYPLMLAPIIKLFGVNFIALKTLNIVSLVLTVLIFYKFVSEKFSAEVAFFSSIIIAIFPTFLKLPNSVISDMSYTLFSVASVYAIDKFYTGKKHRMFWSVITSFACFATFFVRTIGIVSFMTVLFTDVFLLIAKKITALQKYVNKIEFVEAKPIEHIAFYIIFIIQFAVSKLIFPSGDAGYAYYFNRFSLHSILSNCYHYAEDFVVSFNVGTVCSIFVFVIFTALAVAGILKLFYKHFHIVVFCAGVSASVIIFPEHQGLRYISALIPWFFMFALAAVEILKQKKDEQNSKKHLNTFLYKLCCSVIVTVICINFYSSAHYTFKRAVNPDYGSSNYAYTEDALNVYNYIIKNTSNDDIIEFFKPRVLWLNTERKSIIIDKNNAEKLKDVDYILQTAGTSEYLNNVIKNSKNITLEYQCGIFNLYKVNQF